MRKMMISSLDQAIEINVIRYFSINKSQYIIYEKDNAPEMKNVYLARIVRNGKEVTFEKATSENIVALQAIVKLLISNNNGESLKRLKYEELDIKKLITERVVEKEAQLIQLSNEQYDNLVRFVPAKKKSSLGVIVVLLLLLLIGGAVYYFFFMGDKDDPAASNNEYTVSFMTNGGSSINQVTMTEGRVFRTSAFTSEKEGYVFSGWYYDADLMEKADESFALAKDIILYAKWELMVVNTCSQEEDCAPGDEVTLIGDTNRKWYVVEASLMTDEYITLMAGDCIDTIAFDTSTACQESGVCTNSYSKSSIKAELENTYKNSFTNISNNISEIRLINKEEFETLTTIAQANNNVSWLYGKNVCSANDWWTMTLYGDEQIYYISESGLTTPSSISGTDSKLGTPEVKKGVRPIIVVKRVALQ